jgi:hypothetical protein
MPLGVVTAILPEPTAAEAPVPGTVAATEGSAEGRSGSDGMGSSTPAEGMVPEVSTEAAAPAAEVLRPAAEAVTVALLGVELRTEFPPTKA